MRCKVTGLAQTLVKQASQRGDSRRGVVAIVDLIATPRYAQVSMHSMAKATYKAIHRLCAFPQQLPTSLSPFQWHGNISAMHTPYIAHGTQHAVWGDAHVRECASVTSRATSHMGYPRRSTTGLEVSPNFRVRLGELVLGALDGPVASIRSGSTVL